MTNAINTQKAIFMLSAEPLDNEYLDEFSPRLAGKKLESDQELNLNMAPSWFPVDVADAVTVDQLHRKWSRVNTILFSAVTVAVIAGVSYVAGWEIGAFLSLFGIKAAISAAKKTATR